MRIRKRQIPLPFSSISPVPLSSSDPNFNRPPVTVVQLPLGQQQQPPPPPPHHPSESDHHHHPDHPIGQPLPTQTRDSSALHGTTQVMNNKQDYPALNPGEEDEEKKKNDDTWQKTILGAKLGTGSSSSSHYQGGWGEGEKAFPLKKRRGSTVETRGADEDVDDGGMMIMAKDMSNNKKPMKSVVGKNMKTKLNKKLVSSNEEEISKDIASVDNGNNANSNSNNGSGGAKKRGRGGALMEGSRCSRVNGRGWRCCQQTLVGYSLCEHHLGKGRLRSITSVRNRAKEDRMQANKNVVDHGHQGPVPSNHVGQQLGKQTKGDELQHDHDNDAEGEEKKPLTTMTSKKRVKLGMVKARSMSSLLGQNENGIAVADDGN